MRQLEGHGRRFVRDDRGTTSIEYGLIALLVAVGCLVGLQALSQANSTLWGNISAAFANAVSGN